MDLPYCVFTHPWVDIWAASASWLMLMMLLIGEIFLGQVLKFVDTDAYPEIELTKWGGLFFMVFVVRFSSFQSVPF